MKRKYLINIEIIVFILILQSCASFQKKLSNPYLLNEKKLTTLNGTYDALNIEADTISKINWSYTSFFNEMDRKSFNPSIKLDTLKHYKFELKVLSNKRIKVRYLENNNKIGEKIIKGRLKKDGYFYLKNRNIKFWGIPYLAGALHINKTRFSKTNKGNLIFDLAHHQSGAFLLFIFPGGANWDYRNTYKKIK